MRTDRPLMPSAANKWIIWNPVVMPPHPLSSCVWDETQSHLSTPMTQPKIDFLCACVCERQNVRKMNLFTGFHSIRQTIYIFICHIRMRWQWCYSIAPSVVSLWQVLHFPQTQKKSNNNKKAGAHIMESECIFNPSHFYLCLEINWHGEMHMEKPAVMIRSVHLYYCCHGSQRQVKVKLVNC